MEHFCDKTTTTVRSLSKVVIALTPFCLVLLGSSLLRPNTRARLLLCTGSLKVPLAGLVSIADLLVVGLWIAMCLAWRMGACGDLSELHISFVMLPALRGGLVSRALKLPFERALRYHRWIGVSTFVAVVIHGVMVYARWARAGVLAQRAGERSNVLGLLSAASLVLLSLGALPAVRRRAFQAFRALHLFFLPFLILGALHRPVLVPFMVPGLAMWLVDRGARAWRSWSRRGLAAVMSFRELAENVTEIVVTKPDKFVFDAGSYVFVQLSAAGKGVWHPVTIASCPADPDLRFLVRDTGGAWSHAVRVGRAETPEDKRAILRLEGPYGSLSVDPRASGSLILVAAGIGVTPMLSILRDLMFRHRAGSLGETKRIVFVWVVRSRDTAMSWAGESLTSAKAELGEKLTLCLFETAGSSPGATDQSSMSTSISLHHLDRVEQLSPMPHLERLIAGDKDGDKDDDTTTETMDEIDLRDDLCFSAGRPDFMVMFKSLADLPGPVSVLSCGPEAFMRASTMAALHFNFNVHHETFEM